MSAKRPPGSSSAVGSSVTSAGRGSASTTGRNVAQKKGSSAEDREHNFAREDVRKLLANIKFDVAICVVILINAITLGIEQSLYINSLSTVGIKVVETIFLMIYIVELCLRFYGHGRACIEDIWVKMDLVLIGTGLFSWVLENGVGSAPEEMGALVLLRMARLARFAKTLRVFAKVPECKMLIRGLLGSSSIMLYTLMLLLLVVYCFSVLGVEFITKHSLSMGDNPDPVFQNHVAEFYSSVPGTMLTLLRFATMDHISEVYEPLVEKEPWLTLYFLSLIFIVTIMTMNLVASVIFTSMLDANQKEVDGNLIDQERDWGSLISNLKNMFNRIDEDGSGQLTLEEFLEVDKADQMLLCQALEVNSPAEIFRMLDTEKRGEVSINEFFDKILDKVLAAGEADFKRMERQIETMHWRLKENFSSQNELSVLTKSLQAQLIEILSILKSSTEPESVIGKKPSAGGHSADTKKDVLAASRPRQPALEQALPPRPSLDAAGRVLQAWEEDLSIKLKVILDDGLRFALDSLRNVDSSTRAPSKNTASVRSASDVSGPADREAASPPTRSKTNLQSMGSFREATDPQAPAPPKRATTRSGRSSRAPSPVEQPSPPSPKLEVSAPPGSFASAPTMRPDPPAGTPDILRLD